MHLADKRFFPEIVSLWHLAQSPEWLLKANAVPGMSTMGATKFEEALQLGLFVAISLFGTSETWFMDLIPLRMQR